MTAAAEREALTAVFASPTVPPVVLRPQAIHCARECWRRGIPERRIAVLLHLTVPAVHELLAAADSRPPECCGQNLSRQTERRRA